MIKIDEWLQNANSQIKAAGIESSRLDAEIILAHTLRKSRTYLHAHSDNTLSGRSRDIADARVSLRCERTPLAYIIGHKEFYGRNFRVTPATLIPRPESEHIITILKNIVPPNMNAHCVDVGTGSGCLGITAKLELPQLSVTLLDISRHALQIANANARALRAEVVYHQSNLLDALMQPAQYIIANLPYVDPSWQRSPETNREPSLALFAENGGCELIFSLLSQTSYQLSNGGYLLLEADPIQHERIIERARKYRLALVQKEGFVICLQKQLPTSVDTHQVLP